MTRPWTVTDSKLVLDGAPWLCVWEETVLLPSGRSIHPFYRYQKPDFVSIFALDEDGRAILERRYRHGPRAVTLDVPAGHVDRGEEPVATARRELLEETGFDAPEWRSLGAFTTDGNAGGNMCSMFLATGAQRVAAPHEDDTEEAEIVLFGLDAVRRALAEGGFATLAAGATVARALLEVDR